MTATRPNIVSLVFAVAWKSRDDDKHLLIIRMCFETVTICGIDMHSYVI